MHWDGAYKNKYKLCKTVQCWLLLRKYEERARCSVKINGNAILGNKTYLEAQRSEAGLMGLNGEAAWTRAHKIICPLLVRLGRQMFYRKRHFWKIFSDGKTRENIGRHTWAVVLKFFAERTYFTKSQMSTKKQLNIIVNNKQRNWILFFYIYFRWCKILYFGLTIFSFL